MKLGRSLIALGKKSDMSRALTVFCLGSLLLAALYVLQQSTENYQNGGDLWKQGDWLINSELVPVRRAFIGDLILRLSDILGTSPLLVTWIIQVILLIALIVLLLMSVRATGATLIIWIILLSPAFFVFFWAADPRASIRKELIIYVAFLCLLIAFSYPGRARLLILLSTFLFTMGVIGHEGMALFFPSYAICLWLLVRKTALSPTLIYLPLALALVAALGSILYAQAHPSVADFQQICQPLLDRGLSDKICQGSIKWLQFDTHSSSEIVGGTITAAKLGTLAVAYVLSSVGFLFFAHHTDAPRKLVALYLLAALPFAPLFVLGIDWGRWLNFHFSSAVFLVLALLRAGKLKIDRQPDNRYYIPLLLSHFIWSIGHIMPLMPFGILGQAYKVILT